jgi:hypothetical protein
MMLASASSFDHRRNPTDPTWNAKIAKIAKSAFHVILFAALAPFAFIVDV